ncbi:hypothetical protein A3731_00730 [Roseovarius sp. HI0049]|nr:hypothetical protein A3731_00730 [Roseovarius sp. HI0049]
MTAPVTIRAGFRPASADEESRTVELIASTGAGVRRLDIEGEFLEVLEVSERAVDLTRAEGMPLLDAHRQDGLDRVLGVVRGLRIEGGKLVAKVQISERHDPIWRDIMAGIIGNVSIGYAPVDHRDTEQDGHRVRVLTRWELHEISLVAVGADPTAKVRSTDMPEGNQNQNAAQQPQGGQQTATPETETRADVNREIRALAQTFDLPGTWSDDLIDRAASVEDARAAALDALRDRRSSPAPVARATVGASGDDPAAFVTRAAEALYTSRVNPRHEISDAARQYTAMTTLDLARDCLTRAGVQTTGMDAASTITRALHATSDFPAIFADTANRVLREAYDAAPATLRQIARQASARDFRAKTSVQLGEAPTLEKVNEHGEYRAGTMAEAKESYSIDTFGRIVGLSRKAIINDDLSAFTDLSGQLGRAAADFEAQQLVDLLTANPTMDDGTALFHADHGNLAGTGGALDADSLAAARLAMRRQTGLSGRPIAVAPKYLIVPPELETTAEQLLATINPTTTADVNVFGGKLELLVEARLSDTGAWYVAADPAQVPGLEYSYLQGAEGPQIEQRAGFEVDGLEVKIRLDFGAAFLDWRGVYRNAGA